ncbi:MAG: hypothetical protein NXI14_10905 [bacterium]|nr:hypothetical protein [bacterium]
MQTKPNQTDPDLLDTLLKALLQDGATLPGIAARMKLTMADLLELIERPDVQRSLQRLRTALTQRAEIVALSTESAALQNLASVGDDLEEISQEQAMIDDEIDALRGSEDSADRARIADFKRAKAVLAQRAKDRVESARAARAALSHARSRTKTAHDALPQALKLALPPEELKRAL